MATADPKTATAAATTAAAPAVKPDETEEEAPQVERVNMAGLELQKTVYPDGECKTVVMKEPMIAPELVRATRSLQRSRGH